LLFKAVLKRGRGGLCVAKSIRNSSNGAPMQFIGSSFLCTKLCCELRAKIPMGQQS